MNAQITQLRTLVMKELDPVYFNMDEQQISYWHAEILVLRESLFKEMQEEMMGKTDNALLERHLKQIQYDCFYLMDILYKYVKIPRLSARLHKQAIEILEQILTHIEVRYTGFFNLQPCIAGGGRDNQRDYRIRVAFSTDMLAYFFKLLNKSGALNAGPVTHLIECIASNFITSGIGDRQMSAHGLTTRYKQVVQTTAQKVRSLLVKMLMHLDEEFKIN